MLKALFIQTTNSGVFYYRMLNYAMAADRMRIANLMPYAWRKDLTTTHPWEEQILNPISKLAIFKGLYNACREADIVVCQMVHIQAALGTLYALKDIFPNLPFLAEMDDNMVDTPAYNPASEVYDPAGTHHRQVALEQFKNMDGMIVSTPYLKEVYSDYNDNIYVVENGVDLSAWDRTHRKSRKGIRIGWAGGSSHEEDLRVVEPVIHSILSKYRDVSFVLCHGVPPFLRNIDRVEFVTKWARIDHYPQYLADRSFDIGMAPLVDNAFNRGKSNLRWLEYSALGIPTVASNVGHFAQTVKHGIDGLLANDAKEFEAHLETLIRDRRIRRAIGKAAYGRVASDFHVDTVTKTYVSHLEEAITKGVTKVPPPVSSLSIDDDVKPLDPVVDDWDPFAIGPQGVGLPAKELVQ